VLRRLGADIVDGGVSIDPEIGPGGGRQRAEGLPTYMASPDYYDPSPACRMDFRCSSAAG
jgi:hypothetical protein